MKAHLIGKCFLNYHIYLSECPGRLLNFFKFIRGGRLFEAGHLLNFHHFEQDVSLFCNKTINNNKM